MYHYAGNNPVKYIDPDGRENGIPSSVQKILNSRVHGTMSGMPSDVQDKLASRTRTEPLGVYSIKTGVVILVQQGEGKSKDYGNSVIIRDQDGKYVRYAHLSIINIQKGDFIKEGQTIGIMGDTGNGNPVSMVHLHISVYLETVSPYFRASEATENPEDYIKDGTYPCNTLISNRFKSGVAGYDNMLHEGTDFSGQIVNLIDNWVKGLKGKETIDDQN